MNASPIKNILAWFSQKKRLFTNLQEQFFYTNLLKIIIVTGHFNCKFVITLAGDELLEVIITTGENTHIYLKLEAFKNTV